MLKIYTIFKFSPFFTCRGEISANVITGDKIREAFRGLDRITFANTKEFKLAASKNQTKKNQVDLSR